MDVHRDFCEVAIVAEGRLRPAGRIKARPDALELFAQSLGPRARRLRDLLQGDPVLATAIALRRRAP